jgi:hypothetical protein
MDAVFPLSLSEQLDAMLHGWLERAAALRAPVRPGLRATSPIAVSDRDLAEVMRACAGWDMTVRRPARGSIALVEGPARVVEGLAAIFRR